MVYKNFHKIYAVVVWYHPTEKEAQTIRLYQNDVKTVVVVDNSDSNNQELLEENSSIIYIPLLKNKGIATALNIGCKTALEEGADWVLTMDQDSQWNQQSVREYIEEATHYPEFDRVGIFSPYHDCDGTPEKHHRNGRFESRNVIMCSGNLLRLTARQEAKGFREDFFIDLVDDEICCHLHQLGWQVIRTNSINLSHHLGEGIKYIGPTRHLYIPHPAWRYFYIARNIRRMMRLYPNQKKYYKHQISKYIKRLCLYDWTNKMKKLYAFYQGWIAGASNCGLSSLSSAD